MKVRNLDSIRNMIRLFTANFKTQFIQFENTHNLGSSRTWPLLPKSEHEQGLSYDGVVLKIDVDALRQTAVRNYMCNDKPLSNP
jgi:hypothetical protein